MSRPDKVPFWAQQDEVDPVFQTENKVEPSISKQQFGQRSDENTLRQDINYLFNKIAEWIVFFDEQYEVDDVYIIADSGQTEAQISDQLGGTWEFIDGATGQATIAGENVLVFKKTQVI